MITTFPFNRSRGRLRRSAIHFLLFLFSVVAAQAAGVAQESTGSPPEGFVVLFNGKDLSGWCGRGGVNPDEFRQLSDDEKAARQLADDADLRAHWRVENGELVNDGHGVFCTTEREYNDFELLIDWKMVEPHTDSGIYLRGCPQVQIWDPSNPEQRVHGAHLGSGGLWNNNPRTAGKDPAVVADRPVGEWNRFQIRIQRDRVTVVLNDQTVVDDAVMHNYWNRDEPLPNQGPIQLQTHGGEMRFRNIFLHEL